MEEPTTTSLSVPARPRIVVLGDSMASGLGVRDRSFGRLVAKELDAPRVLFKARARRMIDETAGFLPQIDAFGPDLVILSSGMVEGVVHPPRWVERLLERYAPRGWHGDSGLDPRPYYSDDPARRRRQRLTSAAKVALKNLTVRLPGGGYSRMDVEQYTAVLAAFLDELAARGCPVVLVGIGDVHPLLFPRSAPVLRRFDAAQRALVATRPGVLLLPMGRVVDPRTELQADRAHPNVRGHQRLARAILARLTVREPLRSDPLGTEPLDVEPSDGAPLAI